MVESFEFKGNAPGPKLLIFGAIHGDEHCGPVAIRRVMERIENGELPLLRGSVRFVPVCNPKAYEEKKRVRKENLNRVFRTTEHPETDEAVLANELCALVDDCDVLLDIHSSAVPAPSNVFVDYPTAENMAFAKALNPDFLVLDWPEVYKDNPYAFDSWTTDRYAHEAGKAGVLAECGQHDAESSLANAEDYILRMLGHFGVIQKSKFSKETHEAKRVYMTQIFQRNNADDTFAKAWYHLEPVAAGALIARRATGEELRTDQDSYIIFPKEYALPGGEWFYLAIEK